MLGYVALAGTVGSRLSAVGTARRSTAEGGTTGEKPAGTPSVDPVDATEDTGDTPGDGSLGAGVSGSSGVGRAVTGGCGNAPTAPAGSGPPRPAKALGVAYGEPGSAKIDDRSGLGVLMSDAPLSRNCCFALYALVA